MHFIMVALCWTAYTKTLCILCYTTVYDIYKLVRSVASEIRFRQLLYRSIWVLYDIQCSTARRHYSYAMWYIVLCFTTITLFETSRCSTVQHEVKAPPFVRILGLSAP
jgi:hypothetical protein